MMSSSPSASLSSWAKQEFGFVPIKDADEIFKRYSIAKLLVLSHF